MAISGDTAIVGATHAGETGMEYGAAYIFERNQNGMDSWGKLGKLTASDAQDFDQFGVPVAISGDTAVVGAVSKDGDGLNRGAAYIFERNRDGTDPCGQVAKLSASDAEDHDSFGHSVAVSGDTVVVGANGQDGVGGNALGAAYIFERNQGGVADS